MGMTTLCQQRFEARKRPKIVLVLVLVLEGGLFDRESISWTTVSLLFRKGCRTYPEGIIGLSQGF